LFRRQEHIKKRRVFKVVRRENNVQYYDSHKRLIDFIGHDNILRFLGDLHWDSSRATFQKSPDKSLLSNIVGRSLPIARGKLCEGAQHRRFGSCSGNWVPVPKRRALSRARQPARADRTAAECAGREARPKIPEAALPCLTPIPLHVVNKWSRIQLLSCR
jgi:hypothetical protein